ncbi:hypothetical protein FSP39_012813 [Pinctada imbricata]|uniref:Uncharacterized protein n=1 Tax=Pinctada imbricata TaxID=66713 RepID=A0AA88YP21_PINIB|nr:hypothetical protein FSP39_012813 [Pinctada imbricata]
MSVRACMGIRSGEDDKGTISVGGVTVHGSPDVRFNSFTDFESDICGILKLIVVTEVKQFEALRGDYNEGTFIASNISSRVLGQHGIELLMERSDSFFLPGIAGMICMGTKIVFTYLFIKESHYVKILEKGPDIDDTLKSTILYTRPYDYMDMRDRNEILESFFWFGFVQSSAYKAYMFEV